MGFVAGFALGALSAYAWQKGWLKGAAAKVFALFRRYDR